MEGYSLETSKSGKMRIRESGQKSQAVAKGQVKKKTGRMGEGCAKRLCLGAFNGKLNRKLLAAGLAKVSLYYSREKRREWGVPVGIKRNSFIGKRKKQGFKRRTLDWFLIAEDGGTGEQ